MVSNLLSILLLAVTALVGIVRGSVITGQACEHTSSNFHLECHSGQSIAVLSALYGRQTSSVCSQGPINTESCAAPSSLAVVRHRCNGHRTCDIMASNGVFGDPCYGTVKYLDIQYQCQGSTPTNTCEHGTTNLACPVGKTIHVTSALYGRQTSSICTQGPIYTLNCASSNAFNIVRQRCNGLQTCSVAASNSIFGDPCVGTFKYLQVEYSCA